MLANRLKGFDSGPKKIRLIVNPFWELVMEKELRVFAKAYAIRIKTHPCVDDCFRGFAKRVAKRALRRSGKKIVSASFYQDLVDKEAEIWEEIKKKEWEAWMKYPYSCCPDCG